MTNEQTIYNRLDAEWQRDRAGRWTHILHDAGRQVVSVTDPAGRTTTFNNCQCGALETIIDAAGNPTTFEYDVQGRVTRKVYADTSALAYTYEATTSRLKSVLDAKGQRTNYTYEVDDALKTVSYTNATGMPLTPPTPTVTYTYDPIYRRLDHLVDGTGTTAFSYVPLLQPGAGRLLQENGPEAPVSGVDPDLIAHTYDEYGRETGCTVGGVGSTGRGFDWLGRFEQETNALGVSTYGYVGNSGRLGQVTLPGNLASIYTYHPAVPSPAGTGNGDLRLSKITHRTAAGAVFDEQGYDYDAAGNISGWKQNPGVITGTNGALWSFGYDAADQLLGATQQGTVNGVPSGSVTEQDRYDYDAAGNRKVEQRAVLQGASYVTTLGSDTHNALNQVTARSGAGKLVFEGTVSEPAQVSVGGAAAQVWGIAGGQYGYRGTATVQSGANNVPIKATDANGNLSSATAQVTVSGTAQAFGYDANGNLTGDGTWSYGWDAANRLISASGTGALWEWTYNGRGQRVEEKLNSVVQWKLRWCGLELKVMAKPDGSDTRRFFAQGVQRTTVAGGQPTTLAYFTFRDHLGSVRDVTNAAGTLQKRYAYDPWGRRTETYNGAGSFDPLVGFTGHYFHPATLLHFAFYRAYSAELGRWLSRDPITDAEMLPEGPSLYLYVANDPVGKIDFLGLKCEKEKAAVARATKGVSNAEIALKNALNALETFESLLESVPSIDSAESLLEAARAGVRSAASARNSAYGQLQIAEAALAKCMAKDSTLRKCCRAVFIVVAGLASRAVFLCAPPEVMMPTGPSGRPEG